jgi:hypothetical protein
MFYLYFADGETVVSDQFQVILWILDGAGTC